MSPNNPTIEGALAEALVQAHDLDEALPLLQRLSHQGPSDGTILLMYGEALLAAQQIGRAIPILEEAVAAKGASISAHGALGRAYVQTGRYRDALPHLMAAAKDDETGDLYYQLGRAFRALGRQADAQKAMAEYQMRHQRTEQPAAADAVLTPPKG
jgi:predicted Zn-dependent protease